MTFTQMHERLRRALMDRIQRGALSVSLLSRQTGLGQAHISNFLRNRRGLSKEAIDRILHAQHMKVEDLLPSLQPRGKPPLDCQTNCVPVVSHRSALYDRMIYPSAILSTIALPAEILHSLRALPLDKRIAWQRFVAIRVSPTDALGMEPIVMPDALAVIDRHYNACAPYRPLEGTIYAVRSGAHLLLRYVDFHPPRLILRLHNAAAPSESLEIESGQRPQELIVGRIVSVLNRT
jgi:hypothetical protein